MPRVAVVIPCHDDGPLALEAVASVREAEDVEIVVVDDFSGPDTVRTLEGLDRPGARVVRHEVNRGLAGSRMTGVSETSAPYVFNLDADDLAVEGSLGKMADRLDADPAAGVCFGDYAEFGTRDRVREVPHHLDPFRIAFHNEYPTSALFRRSALLEAGGWHPGRGYEDWELWMALAERGERGVHAGDGVITYRRRLHGERMLAYTRRNHREEYLLMRGRHPELFGRIDEHRRASDLSPSRKLLYPRLFGARPRLPIEPAVRLWMDRLGIWRLQR